MHNKHAGATLQPPKRIEEMATKLKADLEAHLHDKLEAKSLAQSSGLDASYGQRIQQLEVGRTELQAHNKQFHS